MEVLTVWNGEDSEGSSKVGRKEAGLSRMTRAMEACSREEDETRYVMQSRPGSMEDNDYADAPPPKPDGCSAMAGTELTGACVSSGPANQ